MLPNGVSMAFKLWIAQENIRRYRRLLDGQSDPQERAAIETLLAAEEATLAAAETAEEELRRRIKRYREKAEELTTVANQCETEEARAIQKSRRNLRRHGGRGGDVPAAQAPDFNQRHGIVA
jgi:hypothetical protein